MPLDVCQDILGEVDEFQRWIFYSHHDHNPDYANLCHGFYPWVLLGDLDQQRQYLDDYYGTVKRYIREGKKVW